MQRHSTLTHARKQSTSRATLSDAPSRCICADCRRHVARLETLNAQLARANDALRRERDAALAAGERGQGGGVR